jgi:outer membrane lipoprotein-sorting protein
MQIGDFIMRRFLPIGALAALAVLVLAQVRGSDLLANFAKAQNGAKSLSATYTVQRVGGTSATYQVDLAKPNKARIDSPTQLVVADGTNITTYDKADKSYFTKPQTDGDLKGLFKGDDTHLFGAFFDADFYAKVPASKAAGTKARKGVTYNVVQINMDTLNKKTISLYLDPSDKMAKVGEFVLADGGVTDTVIVATKELLLDGKQADTLFAFKAPEGSRQITLEEMNSGKWYTDFEEAQAMAKKANKPIFLDFYADW